MDPLQQDVSGKPENWLEEAISSDPVLGRLFPQLRRLAAGDSPILICGEPGSGRELAARAIHNLSHRAAHPFVVLDCADLSAPLIEAELVGMEGNGGTARKTGLFEQAREGTVLLNEVSELPSRGQEVLLRLLERHEIVRLNSSTPVPAHARCLASASVDLRARIPAGLFREELYTRLATEILTLPSLRERRDDIPMLAQHFLSQCCAHLPEIARELSRDAEAALREYSWPGNLRELREAIEEAAIRAAGSGSKRSTCPNACDARRSVVPFRRCATSRCGTSSACSRRPGATSVAPRASSASAGGRSRAACGSTGCS